MHDTTHDRASKPADSAEPAPPGRASRREALRGKPLAIQDAMLEPGGAPGADGAEKRRKPRDPISLALAEIRATPAPAERTPNETAMRFLITYRRYLRGRPTATRAGSPR